MESNRDPDRASAAGVLEPQLGLSHAGPCIPFPDPRVTPAPRPPGASLEISLFSPS